MIKICTGCHTIIKTEQIVSCCPDSSYYTKEELEEELKKSNTKIRESKIRMKNILAEAKLSIAQTEYYEGREKKAKAALAKLSTINQQP